MSEQPFYVVFAGVNGAGKSTLFRSDFWHTGGMPATMARVNPDEILREQGGDWSNDQDQVAAGRIALRSVDEHLAARRSFNQETTLAGHRALRTMAEAREKGYRVFLFYIGLANEGIALQRIERRVQAGGHDIDEALVRKRYRASLASLSKALPYCEEAHVLDNTVAFKRIALWHRNTLAWWGASKSVGAWLPEAIADESLWRRS